MINQETFAKDYVDVAVKEGVEAADAWVVEQNGNEMPSQEFIQEMAPLVREEIMARQDVAKEEAAQVAEAASDTDYAFDNSPETVQEAAKDAVEYKVVELQKVTEDLSESNTEASEGV